LSQPSYSPQQSDEPEESLEKTLGGYKTMLVNLQRTLSFRENLRTIEAPSIKTFELELREIIEGLNDLRGKAGITQFVTSIDALKEKLQLARNGLYTALDALDLDILKQGNPLEVIEARKKYLYPSFTECEQLLLEAIGYFRT
jgi:hypothetical protein